ncbi:MAG: hypothetical protein R6U31_07135 [bacterium]
MRATDNWSDILEQYDIRDPQFSCRYSSLYPGTTAFIHEEGGSFAMLIVRINREFDDFETPYGYGSYISNDYSQGFSEHFFSLFIEECRGMGLIAGIIRFNPLYREPRTEYVNSIFVRNTAYIDNTSHYRDNYSPSCRYMLRRAGKLSGTVTRTDRREDFIQFGRIYREYMHSINCDKALIFSERYFEQLSRYDFSRLFVFRDNGAIMGGALFLSGSHAPAYYHLQVLRNREDYPGAGNVLVDRGIEDAFSNGSTSVLLGGGTTPSPDDSLLRFKLSFTAQVTSFNLGTIVIDQTEYHNRISKCHCNKKYRNYFLAYRYNKED